MGLPLLCAILATAGGTLTIYGVCAPLWRSLLVGLALIGLTAWLAQALA